MDDWEDAFREKSRRRARTAIRRAVITWLLIALGLVVLVMGFIIAVNGVFY